MIRIKSSYYPERGRVEPFNADGLENNPPPKVDNVDIHYGDDASIADMELERSMEFVSWFRDHYEEMQAQEREKKMRKVIAHLNRKPFRVNWHRFKYWLKENQWVFFFIGCASWFIGRMLWFYITGK